jgi:predicted Zn-dependent peptidase
MDNKKKKIFKLKNGVTAFIIPIDTNLTDVSVSILLGQNHEKPNTMEITHYMEHLMGRFTSKKYSDYKEISNELIKRGAITNAFVSNYETNFFIQGFFKDIEYYLDLLANTLSNFYLEKSIVKQEKNAVIQELRGYIAQYTYMFNLKIWKYMYSKYAYQHDYKKHIKNIEKYDPSNIISYIKKHILMHNVIVSVTCPLNGVKKSTKLIKKYFNFKSNNKTKSIKFPIYNYTNNTPKIIYISNKPNKDDNAVLRIMVDKKIKHLSTNHLCLMMLDEILFNFETGIFYKMLRDTLGLVYNVKLILNVDIRNDISSYYFIESSTNYKNIPKLITVIINIIKNLQLSAEQIEYGKQKFLVNYELKKFNNLTSYSTYYGQYLLHKIPIIERSTLLEQFQKLTIKQIKNVLFNFKKDILNTGVFFYYSKKNMNNVLKKKLGSKIKYIVL